MDGVRVLFKPSNHISHQNTAMCQNTKTLFSRGNAGFLWWSCDPCTQPSRPRLHDQNGNSFRVLSSWSMSPTPSSKHRILVAAFSIALAAAVSVTIYISRNALHAFLFELVRPVCGQVTVTLRTTATKDRIKKPYFTVTWSWHERR
jgi:hypothetical protein